MHISKQPVQHNKGKGISIIIPFREPKDSQARLKNYRWLINYWSFHLPESEIIVGVDPDLNLAFSKSVAVNDAAEKANGDIFVIIDADILIPVKSILYCAQEIRLARARDQKLWFIPYRQFYRLTEQATEKILQSPHQNPFQFSYPLPEEDYLDGADPATGHWYGAAIQILPSEAFYEVGGWDPRFRGWGGEDHAAMRATDALYWPHKTLADRVLHLWHPMIGEEGTHQTWVHWKQRRWENQPESGNNNSLTGSYYYAEGNPKRMRQLVKTGHTFPGAFNAFHQPSI